MTLWPFVSKRKYESMRQENVFLRGALHEANKEIRRHQKLLADISTGSRDILPILNKMK